MAAVVSETRLTEFRLTAKRRPLESSVWDQKVVG